MELKIPDPSTEPIYRALSEQLTALKNIVETLISEIADGRFDEYYIKSKFADITLYSIKIGILLKSIGVNVDKL